MKYSITAYDKAENELKRRREAVMNEHEVHAQEIAQRLPEIEVLTRSLKALALHSVTIAIITAFRTVIVIIKVVFRITSHFKQPFNGTFSIGIVLTHFLYIFSSMSVFAYYALHEFRIEFYPESDGNGMSPREKMRTVYSNCRAYADKFHENSPSLFFIGEIGGDYRWPAKVDTLVDYFIYHGIGKARLKF